MIQIYGFTQLLVKKHVNIYSMPRFLFNILNINDSTESHHSVIVPVKVLWQIPSTAKECIPDNEV